MEIVDKDFKVGYVSGFQYAVKSVSSFFHVSFLETCKSYRLRPVGLNIQKKPFIEFETSDLQSDSHLPKKIILFASMKTL